MHVTVFVLAFGDRQGGAKELSQSTRVCHHDSFVCSFTLELRFIPVRFECHHFGANTLRQYHAAERDKARNRTTRFIRPNLV